MKRGVCEVCLYVDGDTSIKDVKHCDYCEADICDKCWYNLWRRGLAAIKKKTTLKFT